MTREGTNIGAIESQRKIAREAPTLSRRRWAWTAMVIAIVTVAAYIPALSAGYIWDDDAYVTENPTLTHVDGLRRIWFEIGATDQYYPLVFTTFWIERHLWGLAPFGYHLVNVVFHASSAILVWVILRRLIVRGAALTAALFALHPVHVESVAWITERKNVLSAVFYLSALLAYLRFAHSSTASADNDLEKPHGGNTPGSEHSSSSRVLLALPYGRGSDQTVASREPCDWRWYALAVAFFSCALLSKTVTLTLPAIFLLLVWWKRGRLKLRDIATVIPLFALGAAAGCVTIWLEKHHVGTQCVDWNLSFADRILIAGRAVWFYLGKLVWPAELMFIYPRWRIPGAPAWHFVAPVGVIAILLTAWALRYRIGKGLFVAIGFFVITLAPALGFVNVYPMRFSFVADHFQYLASLSPLALIAAFAARLPIPPSTGRVAGGALLLALAALTWRQCVIYHDVETLWRDTLKKNSDAWIAHGNLAAELARQGRIDEAIQHYREGLRLKDDAPQIHFNLAGLLQGMGLLDDAVAHYKRTIQLQPRYAEANNNLGVCLASKGHADEAEAHYETALAIKPDYADACGNLANLLFQQGRLEEAIAHYHQAMALAPDNPFFHFNLATALRKSGQNRDAELHYKEAERRFEALLRSKPNHTQAQSGLRQARRALSELGKGR